MWFVNLVVFRARAIHTDTNRLRKWMQGESINRLLWTEVKESVCDSAITEVTIIESRVF